MPATREEAIAILEAGQTELVSLFGQLTEAELNQPATIAGGAWAARDLMGHIAFWEELAVEVIDAFRGGITPRAERIETDQLNAENQAEQARSSGFDQRERLGDAHAALLAALHSLHARDWHARPTWPDAHHASLGETLGGVLGAPERPFAHAYAHLDELRAFVDAR
jgi:DinB superfamily